MTTIDLEERKEIIWSRFVLLEKNTHSCRTIVIIIIMKDIFILCHYFLIMIFLPKTCVHIRHRKIHRGLPGRLGHNKDSVIDVLITSYLVLGSVKFLILINILF